MLFYFRPHPSTTVLRTKMRPIVTDWVVCVVCRSFCLSVCRSAAVVSPGKTAEPIEIPPYRTVWVVDSSIRWGAYWAAHLPNTTEPSTCGGDAVFCQITLITVRTTFNRTQSVTLLVQKRIICGANGSCFTACRAKKFQKKEQIYLSRLPKQRLQLLYNCN